MGDFRSINEAMGQIASDWLLIDVAATLRDNARETDTVARLESDVFVLLLPNLKSSEELDMVAEKVLAALKEPRTLGEEQVFIQPSIGSALFPTDAQQGKDLLHCAQMALGKAKDAGRGQAFRFKAAVSGAFARRTKIEGHLRQAEERNELTLAYQPIIELATGEIACAEALLRWTNTELGSVAPDEFIGIAEETGIIGGIGAWVLNQACRDAKKMNRGTAKPLVIAVNMSVKQLADENIVGTVSDILAKHDMNPAHLKIEMTETAFAGDTKIFQSALEGLRGLGLNIALDDFGTGYSSLSYLHRYRFNQLKIDKSFISNLAAGGDGYLLVENIIRMAHSLRLEVVAEGVETKDQVDLLRELQCDKFQGYFVSKPVALADFQKLLTRERGNATLAA
jgi:diguanylate cyclase (GGDEF)-like protein